MAHGVESFSVAETIAKWKRIANTVLARWLSSQNDGDPEGYGALFDSGKSVGVVRTADGAAKRASFADWHAARTK